MGALPSYLRKGKQSVLAPVLNLLFPPTCLSCPQPVAQHGGLCPTCWDGIRFISAPHCACCGYPFEYALAHTSQCGRCLTTPPPYTAARAVLHYDERSRRLITQLKYADQGHLAPTYGAWLANAGHALISQSQLIIPVPLHYRRFLQRRYNQSSLLAYALARHCSLPVLPDGLTRTRHTQPQASLNRREREKNVRNAFAVTPRHAAAIEGRSILLIDDVMTTAATIHACTRALLKGGAQRVQVLTLARKISD